MPGNPDQLGFAVKGSWLKDSANADALKKFIAATKKGYDYALANPDKAADILVEQAKEAQLDSKLTRTSMEEIAKNNYWTTDDPKSLPGTTNFDDAQPYLEFQYKAGTYKDQDGNDPASAPQAKDLATNEYVG